MRTKSGLGVSLVLLLATLGGSYALAATGHGSTGRPVARLAQQLGYLPTHPTEYANLKAALARKSSGTRVGVSSAAQASTIPADPVANPSWQGVDENDVAPPDTTGAIGPSSYIEIINIQMAIYSRSGVKLADAPLEALTGTSHSDMTDPQVIWDPGTQRFYYLALDVTDDTIRWGFSRSSNPTVIPSSFCNYTADFGYGSSLPDYPKLGQTADFLLIGVNVFDSLGNYTGSDVDWITKPSGTQAVSQCPAAPNFRLGKQASLLNADGSQAFTPEPAVQTDRSGTGWVVATSDVSGFGGAADFLSLFKVTKNANGTAHIASTGTSVPVPSYSAPGNAPQRNSPFQLDTLDGRLIHAVSGADPAHGGSLAIWTSHTVDSGFISTVPPGGAISEVRWYEIDPMHAALFQKGRISYAADQNLARWAFNGAISNDRAANSKTGSFGASMVLGFNSSSAFDFPAIQMVSKIASNPQSPIVLVQQSMGADQGFDCFENPGAPGTCRWGDYAGATPDPVAGVKAATGRVWLTNEWTSPVIDPLNATWLTWNWEARP